MIDIDIDIAIAIASENHYIVLNSRSTFPNASTPVRSFVERPARRHAFPVPLDGDPNLQRASSSDIFVSTFLLSGSFSMKLSKSSALDGDGVKTCPAIIAMAGKAKSADLRVLSAGEDVVGTFVRGELGW
jgi:hypothetical protein